MGLLLRLLLLPAAAVEPPWAGGVAITPVPMLRGLLLGVDDYEGQQPGGAVEGSGQHAGVAAARL